jgi:hypothetical protein
MPSTRMGWVVGVVAVVVLVEAGVADAAGVTCEAVEPGVIEVDGALDDWRAAGGYRSARSDDSELSLRCAYDDAALYLRVDVVDDRVVRTPAARREGEDSVSLSLAARSDGPPLRLRVFPAADGGRRKLEGVPRGAVVEDTLTPRGFAIEASIPLARLAGWGRSTPVVLADVLHHDVDRSGARSLEGEVGFHGRLHFASHLPAYTGFLAATRLAPRDLKLDRLVDLDAAPGTERIVWGGRFLGVRSDSFGFVEIPASSAADVLAVELVDPSATGRPLILTRSRERSGDGSRELLIVWRLDGAGRFDRVLGLEVAQALGGRSIVDRWAWVPAGSQRRSRRRPRPGARDLVVEPGAVVGWDAASYAGVVRSGDVTPVRTPWDTPAGVVYGFDGDAVIGPEPLAVRGRR